jgi:hypothetical protein
MSRRLKFKTLDNNITDLSVEPGVYKTFNPDNHSRIKKGNRGEYEHANRSPKTDL